MHLLTNPVAELADSYMVLFAYGQQEVIVLFALVLEDVGDGTAIQLRKQLYSCDDGVLLLVKVKYTSQASFRP